MARKRFLIIGDGAAGLTAAQRLRRQDSMATIGIFSDDPNPGYFRAALTNYLLGELREDQIWSVTPDFYESFNIHRIFSRVTAVDTARAELWCSTSPVATPYDQLLIATGARARMPSFQGAHLPGVMTLRTIQDARQVVDFIRLRGLKNAVVLGGGALGLEWAHALLEHGVKVTIVERAARFLPNSLDQVASDLLATRLRQAGIEVLLGEQIGAAQPGPDGRVGSVVTTSGRHLACELVAVALGIAANSGFLQSSGIRIAENGAILVDRAMRTSALNVFAAGDVASVNGEQLGLWEPARLQGRTAADNMLGRSASYEPGVHYFATRLFDLDFARVGTLEREGGDQIVDFPRGTGKIAYRRLVFDSGRLLGALMIGERSARVRATGRALKRLIDAGTDVRPIKDKLLNPSFDFDGWLKTQKLLERPAEAATAGVPAVPARLRGTQVLSLGAERASAVPASPPSSAPVARSGDTSVLPGASGASNQGPRGTRMLSIGLVAEAPPPAATSEPIDARLEGLGQAWQLGLAITSIGHDAQSTIVVRDAAVCSLHAQIVRHGQALYLRDAGSRTGTWVNGRSLAEAHKLADGDQIRIGPADFVFRSHSLRRETAERSLLTAHAPHLEVRSGPGTGLTFTLPNQLTTIGSAPHCAVCLNDLGIAAEHARLRGVDGAHALTDLGGPTGTYVRGMRLPPGQEVLLADGEWIRLGSIDVLYTRAPALDAASALRPRARLHLDSGPQSGRSITFTERALVGSGPNATLCISGLLPVHLELAAHNGRFWARDLSGGQSFRSGSPLGAEFAELEHGALLLLGGAIMLRFEEVV